MSVSSIKIKILDFDIGGVYPAEVFICDGLISDVKKLEEDVDLDYDGILIPGFIDSHIHIESTMLTPSNFASAVLPHGTTSVVADAHEIANVLGVEGIYFMINDGESVPFDFYFSAPSCVPATDFETSGAVIGVDELKVLFENPKVVCLGEMMNFPGVIGGEENVLAKLDLARSLNIPIDGHAPLVSGEDLEKYVSQDISTDHECSNFNEAIEKKDLGVRIMVREGSSAKNIDGLLNINDRIKYWTRMSKFGNISVEEYDQLLKHPIFDFLVTDDKNPKEIEKGHLNQLVKKVITYDIDPIEAIKMVTLNPAKHYKLNSGEIKKGKKANFLIVDTLENLKIEKTFINGKIVAENGKTLFKTQSPKTINNFKVNYKKEEDFDVNSNKEKVKVNTIQLTDGELLTEKTIETLDVKNQIVQSNSEKDIIKISVIERYGNNNLTNGFIKGFGLKKGAIATSVSHDSHNIISVGLNSKDMAKAVNEVIKNKGGITIVNNDEIKSLKLPIAGLMSDKPMDAVAKEFKELEEFVKSLGSTLEAPFMTLSFMALLVIPSLKISDKGLFDISALEFQDLIIN